MNSKKKFIHTIFILLIANLTVHLSPLVATAQTSCPEAETEEAATEIARDAFGEGERLFHQGRHRESYERFRCSFDCAPHPDPRFNAAMAAEETGELALAAESYRTLLERYPDYQGRAEVESSLAVLDERLTVVEGSLAALEERLDEGLSETAQDEISEEQDDGRSRRLWAIFPFVLGLATASAGGGLYGTAWGRFNDANEGACGSDWNAMVEGAPALEASGAALMAVGGAALVTALVLFLTLGSRGLTARRMDGLRLALAGGDLDRL